MRGDDGPGGRQLARPDEEVVRETRATDGGDPASDVGAKEPLRVVLVVDLVADADEPLASRRAAQRGDACRRPPGSVRSTQPTTPRMNGVAAAVARNSSGLVDARPGLDEDRGLDARALRAAAPDRPARTVARMRASSSVSHG